MSAFDINTVVVPLTVTATAYEANDCIGGLLTIANAPRVFTVDTITLSDLTTQAAAIDVVFFRKNPSNGTYTDEADCDIHDTDLPMIAGIAKITSSDYSTFSDNCCACLANVGIDVVLEPNTQNGNYALYVLMVARGTPTYVSTSDLQLTLGFTVPKG